VWLKLLLQNCLQVMAQNEKEDTEAAAIPNT
jgi:hypothetical protein